MLVVDEEEGVSGALAPSKLCSHVARCDSEVSGESRPAGNCGVTSSTLYPLMTNGITPRGISDTPMMY